MCVSEKPLMLTESKDQPRQGRGRVQKPRRLSSLQPGCLAEVFLNSVSLCFQLTTWAQVSLSIRGKKSKGGDTFETEPLSLD